MKDSLDTGSPYFSTRVLQAHVVQCSSSPIAPSFFFSCAPFCRRQFQVQFQGFVLRKFSLNITRKLSRFWINELNGFTIKKFTLNNQEIFCTFNGSILKGCHLFDLHVTLFLCKKQEYFLLITPIFLKIRFKML